MSERDRIEAAAEAMMRSMFAPHELPLSDELIAKYRDTARAALAAADQTGLFATRPSVIPCQNPQGCNWPACPPDCAYRPGKSAAADRVDHPDEQLARGRVMTELLPCPFCGGPADFESVPQGSSVKTQSGCWSVGCSNTEVDCIGYQMLATFARKKEAAEAWNKRVPGEGWNGGAVWAMTHACGLLDHIKREWEPTNDWTEFDQSVRDKMSELLRQFHEAALPDGWELLPAPPVGRRGKS